MGAKFKKKDQVRVHADSFDGGTGRVSKVYKAGKLLGGGWMYDVILDGSAGEWPFFEDELERVGDEDGKV